MNTLTPCARQKNTTIRDRLASVAEGLEDSPIMARFVRELIARLSLIIAVYEATAPDECAMHEHRDLSDLVLAGDADAAAALMDRHLAGIEQRLILEPHESRQNELKDSLGFS